MNKSDQETLDAANEIRSRLHLHPILGNAAEAVERELDKLLAEANAPERESDGQLPNVCMDLRDLLRKNENTREWLDNFLQFQSEQRADIRGHKNMPGNSTTPVQGIQIYVCPEKDYEYIQYSRWDSPPRICPNHNIALKKKI